MKYPVKPLKKRLLGRRLRITRRENDWDFNFVDGAELHVQTMWRLRSTKQILVTIEDDRQLFGLEAPVDAEALANEAVAGGVAKSFRFDEATADLKIGFSNGVLVEIITDSSGYESWQAYAGGELLAVGGNGGLR